MRDIKEKLSNRKSSLILINIFTQSELYYLEDLCRLLLLTRDFIYDFT